MNNIEELKSEFPTKLWRQRMTEFDDQFDEECLNNSERILNEFIDALSIARGDQKAIVDAVRYAVVRFNDINDLHDYFIETMEREELYEFIQNAAKVAGLHIDDQMDITEEWREW